MTPESWEEAVERGINAAVAQGFDRQVTDPMVLDRIAGIVLAHRREQVKAKRKAS